MKNNVYFGIFLLIIFINLYTVGCSRKIRAPVNIPSSASILLESNQIDLGTIPFSSKDIKGTIRYENHGSDRLRILGVFGSCVCFAGSSGDYELNPGHNGQITVTFKKTNLLGKQSQVIKILTNDPARKSVKVIFDFEVMEGYTNDEICILPATLDYGRFYRSSIREDFQITFVFPEPIGNYALDSMRVITDNTLSSISLIEDHLIEKDNFVDEHRQTYTLHWEKMPEGYFEEEIVFKVNRVNGDIPGEAVLWIRGDAVE